MISRIEYERVLASSFRVNAVSSPMNFPDFDDTGGSWNTHNKLQKMIRSLKAKILEQKSGRKEFSEEQIIQYFYELTFGLEYFHKKGIAHRDTKADNILLDKENKIKIGDIGITKLPLTDITFG